MKKPTTKPAGPTVRRCAIYTRKSTEEGLEQEFNSLDAQRDSGEAYIECRKQEGWRGVGSRYDDGGFTGSNMDRPALKRLMADCEAGKIDCIVVYKVDRLSRSLFDFLKMMKFLDEHEVAFVSVTQQFNTADAMGRLMMNVLLSFAQFEREIISDRTRDKIAAARKKGKWAGGHPILGYDVDPKGFKLVVNEEEAVRVRAIFDLYLELEGLLAVLHELNERGWKNKRWTTRNGHTRGGRHFDRASLYHLLTNVAYCGKVRHKAEVYDGEHVGIVDAEKWRLVQTKLQRNRRNGGSLYRNQFGAVLKGLIHCGTCNCAMTPTHSTRNKTKRYRYYACMNARARGNRTCPARSVSAPELERFVVDQIKAVGQDPGIVASAMAQAQEQRDQALEELETEARSLKRELANHHDDLRRFATGASVERLAEVQEQIGACEQRLTVVQNEEAVLHTDTIDEAEFAAALAVFDPAWEALSPREQARIVNLLVEKVEYDGHQGTIAVTFRPNGIKALTEQGVEA